jgi:hypothetical protein
LVYFPVDSSTIWGICKKIDTYIFNGALQHVQVLTENQVLCGLPHPAPLSVEALLMRSKRTATVKAKEPLGL